MMAGDVVEAYTERYLTAHHAWFGAKLRQVGISVHHGYYGCESGCCGTQVVFVDIDGDETASLWCGFSFGHDYDRALVDAVKIAELTGLPFVENLDEKKIIEACW